jgi:hypothetical protein
MTDPNIFINGLIALGSLGAAAGAFALYKAILDNNAQLENGNDWKRKQSTINMIKEWNDHARAHIKFLRHCYTDLSDFTWKLPEEELAKNLFNLEVAKMVFAGETPEDRDIRDRIISVFNYFEYVSTAYESGVVDRQSIEVSFKGVMLNTYSYFNPFLQIIRKQRKYEPWLPLALLVSKWTTYEQQKGQIK